MLNNKVEKKNNKKGFGGIKFPIHFLSLTFSLQSIQHTYLRYQNRVS